jgi:5-oxopent-3-ene-1,2,5-tricarboxylate decarboxylase/2-hydroxyhepta-2,4-diene-1,7-dioate isomerase
MTVSSQVPEIAPALDPETARALTSVSIATLSQLLRARGINEACFTGLTAGRPDLRLVGVARTLRYTALREDVFKERGGGLNAQKAVIDSIREGEVLVIEAREEHGAGTIGDILALRLKQRGGVGVVTDGAVRDDATLQTLELPYYRGAVHAAVLGRRHVPMDADLPVTCAGVLVMPGDVIVGDADGVVVVPAALAQEVAQAAVQQEHEECFIAERVRAGDSIDGLYPLDSAQRQRYEEWAKAETR